MKMSSQIKICQLQTQRFHYPPLGDSRLKIKGYRNKEKKRLLSASKFRALDDKGSTCHNTRQFHLQSAKVKSPFISGL